MGASKLARIVLVVTGVAVVLLFVFELGIFVERKRADFSGRWTENYHRNFGGPRGGFMGSIGWHNNYGGDFISGHGVFGQIIKIDNSSSTPSIIVNDHDNAEKIISIKNNTVINGYRSGLKITDLKVDDYIVVIGNPNNAGQIEARLIRLMPTPVHD